MAKESIGEKRIKFAIEEIILSFLGAVIISLGILVVTAGAGWSGFVLGLFVIWLGLLLFTVPMIRKIEQLM